MRAILLRKVVAGRSVLSVSGLTSATSATAVESTSLVFGSRRSLSSTASQAMTTSTSLQTSTLTARNRPLTFFHHTQRRGFAAFVPPGANGEDEESRREVAADLFAQYCQTRAGEGACLDFQDVRSLLHGVGHDKVNDEALQKIFDVADTNRNGLISLEQFLDNSDFILGGNPARIILCVGGPGSGKGVLCERLVKECQVVHLSSGNLLRDEVARGSALGQKVKGIMARGELVSSAIMVALMKRKMRDHPGKRVLLDGFPRSAENARDLITLCGKPELALHLQCDDTVLLERIIGRAEGAAVKREDDNFETALERLRTFHKHHPQTLEWLRQEHVPVINLDCSGTPESVWQQLQAIGRLMRPAVKLPKKQKVENQTQHTQQHQQLPQQTMADRVQVPETPIFGPLFGGSNWDEHRDSAQTGS